MVARTHDESFESLVLEEDTDDDTDVVVVDDDDDDLSTSEDCIT